MKLETSEDERAEWKAHGGAEGSLLRRLHRDIDTLLAEVERLRAERRPFSDGLAQKVIDEQVRTIDRLTAKLAALLSRWPGVWRPIESAPLGQWLLLAGYPWGDNYPPIAVGRGTKVISEWWEQISSTQKELHAETITQWEVEGLTPTHWQPIPEPPHE